MRRRAVTRYAHLTDLTPAERAIAEGIAAQVHRYDVAVAKAVDELDTRLDAGTRELLAELPTAALIAIATEGAGRRGRALPSAYLVVPHPLLAAGDVATYPVDALVEPTAWGPRCAERGLDLLAIDPDNVVGYLRDTYGAGADWWCLRAAHHPGECWGSWLEASTMAAMAGAVAELDDIAEGALADAYIASGATVLDAPGR